MKNLKHPSFIIGAISIIILLFAIGLKSYGDRTGDYLFYISIALGAVHWIWSIFDVVKRGDMKQFQKVFWLIVVVAAPVIGGMLFYIMHQSSGKIVT